MLFIIFNELETMICYWWKFWNKIPPGFLQPSYFLFFIILVTSIIITKVNDKMFLTLKLPEYDSTLTIFFPDYIRPWVTFLRTFTSSYWKFLSCLLRWKFCPRLFAGLQPNNSFLRAGCYLLKCNYPKRHSLWEGRRLISMCCSQ